MFLISNSRSVPPQLFLLFREYEDEERDADYRCYYPHRYLFGRNYRPGYYVGRQQHDAADEPGCRDEVSVVHSDQAAGDMGRYKTDEPYDPAERYAYR